VIWIGSCESATWSSSFYRSFRASVTVIIVSISFSLAQIVISGAGRLIEVNEAAQQVLAKLPGDQIFTLPGPHKPALIWRIAGQVYRIHSQTFPPESLLSMTRLKVLPTLVPHYRLPALLKIPRWSQPFITLIEPLLQAPTLPARLENLKLTPREREVIALRLQGLLIKQIAFASPTGEGIRGELTGRQHPPFHQAPGAAPKRHLFRPPLPLFLRHRSADRHNASGMTDPYLIPGGETSRYALPDQRPRQHRRHR
jgi:hypothetical protein